MEVKVTSDFKQVDGGGKEVRNAGIPLAFSQCVSCQFTVHPQID
jgi:hypothetical protein